MRPKGYFKCMHKPRQRTAFPFLYGLFSMQKKGGQHISISEASQKSRGVHFGTLYS